MTKEEKEQWDIFMRIWVIPALKNTWGEKKCKELVEALEKWEEQEPWIPCSERLPEEYGEYLITWTGLLGANSTERTKPLIGIAEYEIYEPENYEDWITTDYEFRHYHDIKVLAWMPLPAPYESQERSGEE